MPFDVRVTPYEETLDRNLYISLEAMRGHLVGTGPARGHRADRGGRSLGHPLRPVRIGWADPARRPRGGHRLPGPGAVRVRRDRGAPAVDLGRDGRLPLLRPLQPGPLDDPRRALGPSGPNGRSAALARRGRPDDDAQVPVDASGSRWRPSPSASTSGSAGPSRRSRSSSPGLTGRRREGARRELRRAPRDRHGRRQRHRPGGGPPAAPRGRARHRAWTSTTAGWTRSATLAVRRWSWTSRISGSALRSSPRRARTR